MAPDVISSRIGLLVLNPDCPSLHEVEGSKLAVPVGKNGVSMISRHSFEGHVNRIVSDVSAELSRSSMNSDLNLHAVASLKVEKAQCECCGISKECTMSYINRVRDLFCGRWICGLCIEVVKEERRRMGRGVPMEDTLRSHMVVCVKFNKVAWSNPALYLNDAMCDDLRMKRRIGQYDSDVVWSF